MKTGYVYKLCCNDVNIKEIYVGSTANMKERRRTHRTSYNNPNDHNNKYKVYDCIRTNGGFDNWSMILIETVEYNNKHELHARERFHLEELQATLNCVIPTRTKKEYYEEHKEYVSQYRKEWYDANKNYVTQKNKEYQEAHKDYFKQYKKEYREENKDYLKDKKGAKHNCECGGKYTTGTKARHMKTKRHIDSLATITPSEIPT